jgi:Glycosyltransferase family 87
MISNDTIAQDTAAPGASHAATRLKGLAAFFLVAFGCIAVYRSGPYYTASGKQWGDPNDRSDFTVYRDVGQAVLDHTDIYAVRNDRGWAYVYPPPFAVAMVPLAKIPTWLGVLLWYCLSAGLIVCAAIMSYRYVSRQAAAAAPLRTPHERLLVAALPAAVLAVWICTGLARSQASVIMAFCITAAAYWENRGRPLAAGVALAGAVLIKVFPLLFIGYYAWRRKWRMVLTSLAALFVAAIILPAPVFGWHGNLNYIREFKRVVGEPALAASEQSRANSSLYDQLFSSEKPRNQSLNAILYRYAGPRGQKTYWAAALLMAAILWWLGRRANSVAEPWVVGAYMTWMLLVSPVSEDHYYSMLLLPVSLAVAAMVTTPRARLRRAGAIFLAVFAALNLAAVIYRPFELWGSICWATLLLWLLLLYLVKLTETTVAAAFTGNASGGD